MTGIYEGKVCVVTGAASGIGRALAVKLARQGALVAISDVDEKGLEETRDLIGAQSNRVRSDRLDVADPEAVAAYPETVKESLGAASYVFNVAGLTRIGTFAESDLTAFEKIMDVNFWGVVRMSKAFLPHLEETKGGLVNISSIFGVIGFPGQSHYCASKFAVRGFSETIAMELAEKGIRVTSVHPGGVDTNIARNAAIDALPEGVRSRDEVNASFKKAAITSPERAAEIILDGAARGRRRVLVGPDAKRLSFIQRLFPQSYARLISGFVEKARGASVAKSVDG